jgi:hypothetical protein
MELLQEYDFDFKYKRGVDNIVPDALSRRLSRADKEIRREEYSFIADWRLRNEDSYVTYIVGWELN